jgi:hypothetical protein
MTPQDIESAEVEFDRLAWEANSVYRTSSYLLTAEWNNVPTMADAITVLLVTWNARFYNPGLFSLEALKEWLSAHLKTLSDFRKRDIAGLCQDDDAAIRELFCSLLPATQPAVGKWKDRQSPVSVAKSLHLLAPKFFPAWDGYIANYYSCNYGAAPKPGKTKADVACEAYIKFCYKIQTIANGLATTLRSIDKPLLKRIDEYNYVTITLPSQQ